MRLVPLIAGLFVFLLACSGLGALASRSAVSPFILAGAENQVVAWRGLSMVEIAYDSPDEPFAWRDQLANRLLSEGWAGRSYPNIGARRPPFATIWLTRVRQIGPLLLTERVLFGGDANAPNRVLLDVSRELSFGGAVIFGR